MRTRYSRFVLYFVLPFLQFISTAAAFHLFSTGQASPDATISFHSHFAGELLAHRNSENGRIYLNFAARNLER